MNGLEYLLNIHAVDKITDDIGFDITNVNEIQNITNSLKNNLSNYIGFNGLNNINQNKVKEYLDILEKNPKLFERDLSKKINSINKKFTKGDLQKGLLEGIIEILTMKKPSKSKYTRKK